MTSALSPPLLPTLDAILVLDGDGVRLAGKYYGDFLKKDQGDKTAEELKTSFEKQLQSKVVGISARADAAEVVSLMGKTAVFCGGVGVGGAGAGGVNGGGPGIGGGGSGGDVRVVHVGPQGESELVLAYLCEGMYDALSHLMGGSTDRTMVLDNLELVFLLIDEHCDGGLILETDGSKLASAVLLRDDEAVPDPESQGVSGGSSGGLGGPGGPVQQGLPAGVSTGDMTIGQALRQARANFLSM